MNSCIFRSRIWVDFDGFVVEYFLKQNATAVKTDITDKFIMSLNSDKEKQIKFGSGLIQNGFIRFDPLKVGLSSLFIAKFTKAHSCADTRGINA